MKIERGERKLIVICACALAIPLAVAAFIGHINKTPIIAATPPIKAPVPNGYDLYVAASNLIRPANPAVDAILESKWTKDPKVRAQRYSLKRKDAWLRQNRAGFALFEKAQKADSLAPLYSMANGKAIRQMARYKVIESNAHWQRGNHNRAFQSGLDVLQLNHDIQRGSDINGIIAGSGIQYLALRATGDTIEHLDGNVAKFGARRLENLLATRWTWQQVLVVEQMRGRQNWIKYFETHNWRDGAFYYRPTFGGPVTLKERWRAKTISKSRILADHDAIFERAIRTARLDYGIETAPSLKIDNIFLDSWPDTLTLYHFRATRALNADLVLMLRLALHAYTLEHGAPPRTLQTLVPNYIRAVPADPFGKGAPLRYKSEGKNYKLWSIGPDGRDDGGKPIPWRKKTPVRYADEREKLPFINDDSIGDYVAGKNH